MHACIDWYCLPLANVTCSKSIGLGLCCLTITMKMSPNWCKHATTNACKNWQILHFFSQLWFPNVHMPCVLCVGLDWCYLLLADVASINIISLILQFLLLGDINVTQVKHTCHGLCVHDLENASYHFLTMLARCVQTMLDAWRLLLMLLAICRYCLVDPWRTTRMSPSQCNHTTTDA